MVSDQDRKDLIAQNRIPRSTQNLVATIPSTLCLLCGLLDGMHWMLVPVIFAGQLPYTRTLRSCWCSPLNPGPLWLSPRFFCITADLISHYAMSMGVLLIFIFGAKIMGSGILIVGLFDAHFHAKYAAYFISKSVQLLYLCTYISLSMQLKQCPLVSGLFRLNIVLVSLYLCYIDCAMSRGGMDRIDNALRYWLSFGHGFGLSSRWQYSILLI